MQRTDFIYEVKVCFFSRTGWSWRQCAPRSRSGAGLTSYDKVFFFKDDWSLPHDVVTDWQLSFHHGNWSPPVGKGKGITTILMTSSMTTVPSSCNRFLETHISSKGCWNLTVRLLCNPLAQAGKYARHHSHYLVKGWERVRSYSILL